MKTLAIFGDSFASINPMRPASISTAWPNLLDSSRWHVTNWAMPGTSFYWTYRLFLEHHSRYDQVVCVVTKPGRITLREEPYVLGVPFSVTGIRQAEWLLTQTKQQLTAHQRVQVGIMRDYMMHIQDNQYEIDANSQLLEHLKRIRPDAIFIPMADAMPNLQALGATMVDFTRLIVASLKPELMEEFFGNGDCSGWIACQRATYGAGWIARDELDPIQCHMTPEVNALMARCVESALATGIWAPRLPKHVDHSLTWDDYYKSTSMFVNLLKKFK